MRHLALDVIRDEHQALAAMLRSLAMLLTHARREGTLPDFAVLRAMLFYVDEFPERLHHTKESQLLFPKLRDKAPCASCSTCCWPGSCWAHRDERLLSQGRSGMCVSIWSTCAWRRHRFSRRPTNICRTMSGWRSTEPSSKTATRWRAARAIQLLTSCSPASSTRPLRRSGWAPERAQQLSTQVPSYTAAARWLSGRLGWPH